MKRGRLLIIGASGHGRVAADCASSQDAWTEIVFFDDRWPSQYSVFSKWPVAGTAKALAEFASESDEVFVAIGHGPTRLRFLSHFQEIGLRVATILHPHASVSSETKIDCGSIVVAGAVINIGTTAGMGCIINTGSSVDHDCVLSAGVHVCPGARLAGDVHVGAQSWIGIGAVVRQGIKIGSNVTVGAGAVVVKDIPDDQTVVGVPAQPLSRPQISS